MKSSLLFQYFNILDKKERIEFQKFLFSEWIGSKSEVMRLWKLLNDDQAGPSVFSSPTVFLNKESVFNLIFEKKKAFNDLLLRQTMSDLTQAIRDFLIYKTLKNSNLEHVLLAKALQYKNADRLLEKELTDAIKANDSQILRHGEYHFNRFQLLKEDSSQRNRRQRSGDLRLQEVSEELTHFYVVELLKQACSMLSHQTMTKRQYDLPLLDVILEKIENGTLASTPSVSAYFHAYKCLSDNSQTIDFQQLKNIIIEKWQIFPKEELRDLYLLTINFCIKKLNQGEEHYNFEALDIYKTGLQNEALLENKQLSPFTYNNILRLAIKTKNWDWAAFFLEEYKNKLPSRERDNYFKYNLALFLFRQKNYEKAMILLQEVSLKEVLYNLDARQMLMRIYFELGEWQALDSLLDSFKVYLHRQNDISYHRESYQNLIKFTQKLLKTDLKNQKLCEILRGQIEETKLVTEKEWLLKQLDLNN
jgi:hypothetical protein